jgi:hypothetical protein
MALTPWECKSVAGASPRLSTPHRGPRLYPSVVAEMHDATEEYLETILEIEEEGSHPARLVERLRHLGPACRTVNCSSSRAAQLSTTEASAHREGPQARCLDRAPPPPPSGS